MKKVSAIVRNLGTVTWLEVFVGDRKVETFKEFAEALTQEDILVNAHKDTYGDMLLEVGTKNGVNSKIFSLRLKVGEYAEDFSLEDMKSIEKAIDFIDKVTKYIIELENLRKEKEEVKLYNFPIEGETEGDD